MGGALQILGVFVVLAELREDRAKLRKVAESAIAVRPVTFPLSRRLSDRHRFPPVGDADMRALDLRTREIAEDQAELARIVEEGFEALRSGHMHYGIGIDEAYRELADATAPHRWASWAAASIILGVALATVGGMLAIG